MTRRPVAGSFAASMFGAAARGSGLIALAVAIGVVLLQISDDASQPLAAGRETIEVDDPGPSATTTTGPADPTTATTATAEPGAAGAEGLTVLVLNASGRDNQARPLSERLQVVGYRTLEPGNAPRRDTTAVLCRADQAGQAAALVAATGLPAKVSDLGDDSEFPGSEDADCVVVIGAR